MRGFNYKKAVQALNYLAVKNGGSLNKMKAIKLIWLADRLHLRSYGRTITNDIYFALKNGPVASTTRDLLEKYSSLTEDEKYYSDEFIEQSKKHYYKSIAPLVSKVFSVTDLKTLELIYSQYGEFDQFQLRDLSHDFPEWSRYKSAFDSGGATRIKMDMMDFFQNVNGYELFNKPENELNTIKELFLENSMFNSMC